MRSVSPVHLEYLRNMGSNATLTISLMAGEALWGLIACHHSAPRRISTSICAAVELFGQIFSQQIDAKEQARELQHAAQLRAAHDRLITGMGPETSIFDDPAAFEDLVKAVIPCDGFGVWSEKGFKGVGTTPPAEGAARSAAPPRRKEPAGALRHGGSVAGACLGQGLRVRRQRRPCRSRSRGTPREYLLFFRREVVETVRWGGDPKKPVTVEDGTARIGPRKSFDAWREIVHGQSVPWRGAELQVAETLRSSLLEVILRRADIVNRERRDAHDRQAFLIAELNHRVKNILALIRSLVRQSRQNAISMEGFSQDLEQRIRALALAHDQLTQTGGIARRSGDCSKRKPGPGPTRRTACRSAARASWSIPAPTRLWRWCSTR